jgi:excinuclease ABC subunit C
MLQEVLQRRISRGKEEEDLPDLMVVDGGKGQLSAATRILDDLGVKNVDMISLAKERRSRGTTERVFTPGRSEPAPLPSDSPESLYLQRIRDEAHRFAITYHRQLRRRRTLATGLEEIPGIGKARRRSLIDRFRTLDGIRSASVEEIAGVVGPRMAERIHDHFHRPESGSQAH